MAHLPNSVRCKLLWNVHKWSAQVLGKLNLSPLLISSFMSRPSKFSGCVHRRVLWYSNSYGRFPYCTELPVTDWKEVQQFWARWSANRIRPQIAMEALFHLLWKSFQQWNSEWQAEEECIITEQLLDKITECRVSVQNKSVVLENVEELALNMQDVVEMLKRFR